MSNAPSRSHFGCNASLPRCALQKSFEPAAFVVSRTRASVPGCPNWDRPASPDFENQQMSNFGCAVSGNIAAMVANPQDLVHGREGSPVVDSLTASKAVNSYRSAKPTGEEGLQEINTKKGGK